MLNVYLMYTNVPKYVMYIRGPNFLIENWSNFLEKCWDFFSVAAVVDIAEKLEKEKQKH